MREKDKELEELLKNFPKLGQRQYDLTSQLYYLSRLAVKCGLYDAHDYIKKRELYPIKYNA